MKLMFMVLLATVASEAIKIKWSPLEDVVTEDYSNYDLDQEWANFKKTFSRNFQLASYEENRKAIFENNLRKIKHHNYQYLKGVTSYKMGVNQFTDMTSEEFKKNMLSPNSFKKLSKKGSTYLSPLNPGELPKEVDWTKEGYVTPVKNQRGCQACWAFSATGAIEGQHFRKTGKLVSLSEQNLVDCSSTFGNKACLGGVTDWAFEYIKNNSGIDTEESYPYNAWVNSCDFRKDSVGATVSGYVDVEDSEEKLKEAIAHIGPISVAINAIDTLINYKEGIHDNPDCDPENIDHGVLVVGYGTENGKDYYLVKNSWGTTWGDNGYIKMSRNRNNQCGITKQASYPVV